MSKSKYHLRSRVYPLRCFYIRILRHSSLHLLFCILPCASYPMASTKQVLRHVVLLKFKENTPAADITNLEDEFRTLAKVKVSEVKNYEWGTNVGKENLNQGYTHCFLLTFDNEKDRDVYMEHKDHLAFVELLKPHMDAATVVAFWANN